MHSAAPRWWANVTAIATATSTACPDGNEPNGGTGRMLVVAVGRGRSVNACRPSVIARPSSIVHAHARPRRGSDRPTQTGSPRAKNAKPTVVATTIAHPCGALSITGSVRANPELCASQGDDWSWPVLRRRVAGRGGRPARTLLPCARWRSHATSWADHCTCAAKSR